MTRAECVLFLGGRKTAIEFVSSLADDQLPANEDELLDAYVDWLEKLLGLTE